MLFKLCALGLLRSTQRDDTLDGGNDNDILRGSSGDDTLTGGSGADFFSGSKGKDTATDFSGSQGDTQDLLRVRARGSRVASEWAPQSRPQAAPAVLARAALGTNVSLATAASSEADSGDRLTKPALVAAG